MKAVFLAMALSGLAAKADAVTLINGSFEEAGLSTPAEDGSGSSGLVAGWTIGPDGVGLLGQGHSSSHGTQSAHLGGGRAGTLSQTVGGLEIGGRYEFRFDFRGGRGADPMSRVVFAMLGTPSITYWLAGVDEGGTPEVFNGWTRMIFYFEAQATDLTLSFYTPYVGKDGVVLDDVRLGVAPVPAALPMLAAALGGLVWLRRKVQRKPALRCP